MLSDEQLNTIWTDAFRAEEAPSGSSFQQVMYAITAGGIAALRAVEAAVRADQIKKDAALAREWLGNMHRTAPAKAFPDALEAAIRAQLEGEN
jgi:hypothetical protein